MRVSRNHPCRRSLTRAVVSRARTPDAAAHAEGGDEGAGAAAAAHFAAATRLLRAYHDEGGAARAGAVPLECGILDVRPSERDAALAAAEGAVSPPPAVPAGIARDGVSERVAPGSHWTLLSAGVGAADVASSLVEWMGAALEEEELERE